MKRSTMWMFAGCVSTLVMAGEPDAATGLTAEQVVEKNVAARGGVEAWRNIRSMVWIGHIERLNGPASGIPFVLEQKRPNKTRFEVKAQYQSAVRAFDGMHGWKQHPASSGAPELQPYTDEELGFARDGQGIDGPLMDHRAKGVEVALEGVDEVEGRKAYRLKVKLPSGAGHHVWIDAQTFLDVKYDRQSRNALGRHSTTSVYYRNYREIDGLQIPLMIESGADTGKATDKMVIDKLVLNPSLPDVRFARPDLPTRRSAAVLDRNTLQPARILRPRSAPGMREAR